MKEYKTSREFDLGYTNIITIMSGTKQVWSFQPNPHARCKVSVVVTETEDDK
jgi:hypothetical protein